MTKLNITERRKDDVLILDLKGKIILGEETAKLRQVLRQFADAGERKILLNLAQTSLIDSSGLGEIVSSFTSFEKIGGGVKLVNLPERILGLMTLTKLSTIFDIFDNEAEAVKVFNDSKVKASKVAA